ncbi:ribonuclease E activity regulator RraA [Nocardioides sp. KR10-350]|uniref:ribonuclease E activity regulator RraA n=1 Tax=Nocardioides cheoyonin TaxID=3156615 RepID=UPI0032B3AFB3
MSTLPDLGYPETVSTADLCDRHGETLRACTTQFLQLGGVAAFSGPIVTVDAPEDNLLLKHIIAEPGEGRVLVVDGGGLLTCALVGDHMASTAANNGWAGLIINGAVRDRARLCEIPIGLKAVGCNPRRSGKQGTGRRDIDVEFGNLRFHPGDMLWSDDDGIVLMRSAGIGE